MLCKPCFHHLQPLQQEGRNHRCEARPVYFIVDEHMQISNLPYVWHALLGRCMHFLPVNITSTSLYDLSTATHSRLMSSIGSIAKISDLGHSMAKWSTVKEHYRCPVAVFQLSSPTCMQPFFFFFRVQHNTVHMQLNVIWLPDRLNARIKKRIP